VPALNELAAAVFSGPETYADRIHFVHIYCIEPHPRAPDPSPYTGRPWESTFSTRPQTGTYNDRLELARETEALIDETQLMLVDDLTPGERNNPVWCTYGSCPNCAYLFRRDATVEAAQLWFDAEEMKAAIDGLLR